VALGWFRSRVETPEELIARGRCDRAIELLREEFAKGRREPSLRLLMADALAGAGRGREALPILIGVADECARTGHAPLAIAALKKVQEIEPGHEAATRRLAELIREPALAPAAPAEVDLGALFGEDPEPEEEVPQEPVQPRSLPEPPSPPQSEVLEIDLPAEEVEDDLGTLPPLASPLFSDLEIDELLALMRGLVLRRLPVGEIVVAEGEPGDRLFVITAGRVKVFVRNSDGSYTILKELGEGDFFGEISVLTGRPRTATVTTASACELLELDAPALERLVASYPRMREVLHRFLTERLDSVEERRARAVRSR
jgi:hypothetical protein